MNSTKHHESRDQFLLCPRYSTRGRPSLTPLYRQKSGSLKARGRGWGGGGSEEGAFKEAGLRSLSQGSPRLGEQPQGTHCRLHTRAMGEGCFEEQPGSYVANYSTAGSEQRLGSRQGKCVCVCVRVHVCVSVRVCPCPCVCLSASIEPVFHAATFNTWTAD